VTIYGQVTFVPISIFNQNFNEEEKCNYSGEIEDTNQENNEMYELDYIIRRKNIQNKVLKS